MDRNLTRARLALLAGILAVSLGLNLVGIGFGQPRHYDQSVDAVHPTFSLDAVEHVTGERSLVGLKYPRLHFLVVGWVQQLYVDLGLGDEGTSRRRALMDHFRNAPPLAQVGLRESFKPFTDVIGPMIVAGRVVSAVMGTLLVLAMFLFTRELLGTAEGLIAAALTAVSYPVVFYAHTLNVDVPYLAWGVLGLFAAARAVRLGRGRWLVVAAVFAALSVGTKDQAGAWFVLTAPVVLWLFMRPGSLAADAEPRPFPLAAGLTALVTSTVVLLASHGLPFDRRGFDLHFDHIFGDGVQPFREFDSSYLGHWLLLGETSLHLADALGVVALVFALLCGLLLVGARPRVAALCLVPAVSYYATFIAPIGYVYLRFTIPILLMLLVPIAWGIGALLRVRRVRFVAGAALLALLVERGELAVAVDRMLMNDPRVAAYRWFEEHMEPDDRVVAVVDLPMHNLDFPVPEQARFLMATDPVGTYGEAPPDYLVRSSFEPPRKITEKEPPAPPSGGRVRQFGRDYDVVEAFSPIRRHPLGRGASFQPTIHVFRRVDDPAAGSGE